MFAPSTSPDAESVRVLELDPALAEGLPAELRERAVAECVAPVVRMPVGRWSARPAAQHAGGIGLLVLEGLLVRRAGLRGRYGAELLGEGDLLRPWEGEDEPSTLPVRSGWRVLQSARVAVLGEDFVERLADYPQLGGALVGRAVGRSRSAVVNIAIVHQARVDVRLQMLFWHLAARWGRVGSGGVTLPLPLTHAVLAELAAARRPTVTSALTQLAKQGLVVPTGSGWLLAGEPPGELGDISALQGACTA